MILKIAFIPLIFFLQSTTSLDRWSDIEDILPKIAASEAKTAKSCASGKCKTVPITHHLQIRVHFSPIILCV